MKKLFLFIGALSLVACSNDPIEFNDVNNPKIYAERIPGVNSALPDAWELEITGSVLTKVKINSSEEDSFVYSGGKLIGINHFVNSNFSSVDEFTYDVSGNLLSIINKNSSDVVTLTRFFNYSNPDLIEEVVSLYNPSGNITGTYTLFKKIVDGNLVKYNFGDWKIDTYSYDDKGNVFSDLISLNELVLFYSNDKVGKNNRTSSVTEFYYNGNLLNSTNMNFVNEYNNNNKIIKRVVFLNGVEHYKVNFTY